MIVLLIIARRPTDSRLHRKLNSAPIQIAALKKQTITPRSRSNPRKRSLTSLSSSNLKSKLREKVQSTRVKTQKRKIKITRIPRISAGTTTIPFGTEIRWWTNQVPTLRESSQPRTPSYLRLSARFSRGPTFPSVRGVCFRIARVPLNAAWRSSKNLTRWKSMSKNFLQKTESSRKR